MTGLAVVLVNAARKAGVLAGQDVPGGWVIGNAPRPLAGRVTWTGPFLHGIHYAAAPEVVGGAFGWAADDARLVVFTGNDEILQRVLAKAAGYGYADRAAMEADGITVEMVAHRLTGAAHERARHPWRAVPAGRSRRSGARRAGARSISPGGVTRRPARRYGGVTTEGNPGGNHRGTGDNSTGDSDASRPPRYGPGAGRH